jgi:DNA-binding GntR family transcriptional regulator
VKRRRDFFIPSVVLDKASSLPLHRQIHNAISEAIRRGEAHHGDRLPSTRMLAKLLQVSRNTVLAAYDDLAADNLICGQRGAGMLVNGGPSTPGVTLFGLHHVIRAAHYPAKVLALADPDGNPLYIRF